jgi:hypothetical protein
MRKLQALLGILLVVGVIYLGYLAVPMYISNMQLEEYMNDTALRASVGTRQTESELREAVLREAQSMRIPLQPENIFVQRDMKDWMIWGEYDVQIDFPFYPFKLHFTPKSESKKRAG